MTAKEYKLRHGLNLRSPLINNRLISTLSNVHKGRGRVITDAMRQKAAKTPRTYRSLNTEKRNERGTCEEQVLAAMRELAIVLGKTPTVHDLPRIRLNWPGVKRVLRVESYRDVVAKMNMVPARLGTRHTTESLIEALRDWYVDHQRLPTFADWRAGVLPSPKTYVSHFGGIAQTYAAAGLGLVYAKSRQPSRPQSHAADCP